MRSAIGLTGLIVLPLAGTAPALAEPGLAPRGPWPAEVPSLRAGPEGPPALGYALQLKLVDDADGANDPRRAALEALLARYDLTLAPLFGPDPEALALLLARAEDRSGRRQPDLRRAFEAVPREPLDPPALASAARALHALPITEWVHLEPRAVPPPLDIPPVSDDFRSAQTYVGPDPGIDAAFAATLGLDGAGLRVYDCEYGWDDAHEDLTPQVVVREPNQTEHPVIEEWGWDDHGTAVVGIVGAAANAYGVTGMVPAASFHLYSEYTLEDGSRRAAAVAAAIADARPGDVVILEMQTFGAGGDYAPAEYSPAIWQATRVGVDAGVVVVAAAGNGNEDLDAPVYAAYRARGSSGAIIVGAGTADVTHAKLGFSTFGQRVDLQGWGTAITTLGYGGLAEFGGDPRQSYTASFGGTSGATPIVASAVVLLQQYARDAYGPVLDGPTLRDLLVTTGVPQDPASPPIGPLPDVRAALDELDRVAPVIERVEVPAAREGEPVTLTVTATGARGPLEVAWTVGGDTFTGPRATLQPEDDAVLAVEVEVRDALGLTVRSEEQLEVTNVPPRFEAVATATAVEGSAWTRPLPVVDPGTDTLTLELVDASVAGAVVADGALAWTPTYADAQTGRATFTVRARDDDGGEAVRDLTARVLWLDADADGQADTWERAYGLDPADPADAELDVDGDGRTSRMEFELGTDPNAYDGPDPLGLLSPTAGTVDGEVILIVRNPAFIGEHTRIRFEYRSEDGAWSLSEPLVPGEADTRFAPGDVFAENARVEWRAFAEDAYVTGPRSETVSFLFSRENEPPPVPTVTRAPLDDDGGLSARVAVTDVGLDPEGAPVTVEVQVRRGEAVVFTRAGLAPVDGAVSLTLQVPGDDGEGLLWTARCVDADGVASAWATPARLDAPEGCGCTATPLRADRGPPLGGFLALAGLGIGLGRRRRRR